MGLERVKVPHGVYIRISGDSGQQIGAHVEYVERVVDTDSGDILSHKMLPPEPLGTGHDALAPLIGDAMLKQSEELKRLRGELAQAQQDAEQARNAALGADAARGMAEEQAQKLGETNTELVKQIEDLREQLNTGKS